MPKISVIIPAYNVEPHMEKCLTSIQNQTFNEFEVIIINDGSTDNTLEIINKYVEQDKRFICYTQENSGQATARNFAIQKAIGDYIIFVDSDDYIDNYMFEKLYFTVVEESSDIGICNLKTFGEEEIIIKKLVNKSNDNKRNLIISDPGPTGYLIKKDIILNNNLYFLENHVYEDLAVFPLWGLCINKISYVNEELYFYLIHSGSTMKQMQYNPKLEDIFNSIDHLYKEFERRDANQLYTAELEYIYIKHFLHAASLRFLKFHDKQKFVAKIADVMKEKFPNWKKNKYYKNESTKYKILCNLIYKKKFKLLEILLKKDG